MILVTGAGGPAGRSLLSQLRDRGLRAIGCDLEPGRRADGIPVEPVPAARDADFLPALRQLIVAHAVGLVIPTVSEELPVIAEAGIPEALIATPRAIALADDKWLTIRTLAAAGVPVPHSVQGWQASETAAAILGTPYIVKPAVSRGGRGVRLESVWPPAQPIAPDEIISEFAPGAEYCVDCFIAEDPADDVAVVLHKTALAAGRVGNATGVRVVREASVATLALAASRALGLRGPTDVDIRRRHSCEPVVLEINARFGAQSAHAPQVLDAVLAFHLGRTEVPA